MCSSSYLLYCLSVCLYSRHLYILAAMDCIGVYCTYGSMELGLIHSSGEQITITGTEATEKLSGLLDPHGSL